MGLGWASEAKVCEQLDDELADTRLAALDHYFEQRCDQGQCESIELVSTSGCRAKVRVIERRGKYKHKHKSKYKFKGKHRRGRHYRHRGAVIEIR